ncbi:hypothetical protein PROFUN_12789 [Planoprotostelium fungivorum]|uniref:Uncharacterized protein n=1 Tax=Planoprotostelium fungivorum TaxID=1890364 RepID=A0A2P6N6G7_9EUKA|nr:hypothetical protein PROFUN_12789 [Planoprotostelium fungivorum]
MNDTLNIDCFYTIFHFLSKPQLLTSAAAHTLQTWIDRNHFLCSLQQIDFLEQDGEVAQFIHFDETNLLHLAQRCCNLREFRGNINDSFGDDVLLQLIDMLPQLEVLHLVSPSNTRVTDKAMEHLSSNLSQIRLISIKTIKLQSETIELLLKRHGKTLSYFYFGPLNDASPPSLEALECCLNLEKLDLSGFQGLESFIENSPQLKELLIDSGLPRPRNLFLRLQHSLEEVIIVDHSTQVLLWLADMVEAKVALKRLHIFVRGHITGEFRLAVERLMPKLEHLCLAASYLEG